MAQSKTARKGKVAGNVPARNVRILSIPNAVKATLATIKRASGARYFIDPTTGKMLSKFKDGVFQVGESFYSGARCLKCEQLIGTGNWFVSQRGKGALHLDCYGALPDAIVRENAGRSRSRQAETEPETVAAEVKADNKQETVRAVKTDGRKNGWTPERRAAFANKMLAARGLPPKYPATVKASKTRKNAPTALTYEAGLRDGTDDVYAQIAGKPAAPASDNVWDLYTPYAPVACTPKAGRPRVRHTVFTGTLDKPASKSIATKLLEFAGRDVEVMLRIIVS